MDWFIERLSEFSGVTAFVDGREDVSYEQLLEKIQEFEHRFRSQGIRRGDVIVIVGRNDANLFAGILSIMKMGCIVAPLTENAPIGLEQARAISSANWTYIVETQEFETHQFESAENCPKLISEIRAEGLGGLILYTSGSTGHPKGILYDSERLLEKFRLRRPALRALSFLAFDHFGGINTVLSIISTGGEVIVLRDRRVETVCEAVQRHRVRVLPTTPSFLRLLLTGGQFRQYDLSSLEKITYGTEPMSQSTLDKVRAEFPGIQLQQTYGLSEVGVLRSKSRADGSLWLQIGGNGFDWKVTNGTLRIRSEFAMRGYLNAEAEFDDDGFFNTQDEVRVDGDYVQILGRASDIINIGGIKIYPAEIEDCIEELDEVAGVAAYGVPNGILGQVIAIDVELAKPLSVDHVRQLVRKHCKSRLGTTAVPTHIRVVDQIKVSKRYKKVRDGES